MTKLLISVPYYSKEIPGFVTADIREWPLFIMFMWCYSLSGGSFAVIAWTSYKVWKHLKVNEHHMTPQTKDANHQITKTLVTQVTVPVFVVLLPIAVIVGTVFLRIDVDGIGLIFSLFWGWIPVVNTVTTIFVVKSYRKAVFRCIHWPSNRNSHVSSIPAIATSHSGVKEIGA
uniref:G protein-coupled receptor n=1 Tax=Panagrolaimus sp. PS1159 TaxID=55785 RepID=A0AC35GL69_9BILA